MYVDSIEILGLPMVGEWKRVQADYHEFLRDPKCLPYFQWSIQEPSPEDPMEKVRRDLDSERRPTMDASRLQVVRPREGPAQEIILLDGKPIAEFGPIELEVVHANGEIKVKASRRYRTFPWKQDETIREKAGNPGLRNAAYQPAGLAVDACSAIDAENQRIAAEAADFIHRELSGLKGPWVVHEQNFLPANVECDHGGRCHFDAIIARHVLAAIRKSQVYLPNSKLRDAAEGEDPQRGY